MRWRLSPSPVVRTVAALLSVHAIVGALGLPTGAAADSIVSGYGRSIQFAGYEWRAKLSNVLVGPGPNFFADSPDNVRIDDEGHLHLRVSQDAAGRWQAAEVVLQPSLGYGTYRFYLEPLGRPLDLNAVFGLFTWNDDPAQSHREFDIELAQWGDIGMQNGRYSVQPYELPEHMFAFDQDQTDAPVTQVIDWQPGRVSFATWRGWTSTPCEQSLIAAHVFVDGIPSPGGEQIRMNLWLDSGKAPTDGQPIEVVMAGFDFAPYPPHASPDPTGDNAASAMN
jgi:hypothetical protein